MISNTCYTFLRLSSLLHLRCYELYVYFRTFSPTTITQISSLKCNEKITCGICGTQNWRIMFWQQTKRFSTGTLQFLGVRISQQLPRLTSLYFFGFLNWRLKSDYFFVDNGQLHLNNEPLPKAGKFYLASNKIQKQPSCIFHPCHLPIILRNFDWVSVLCYFDW